MKSSKIIGLYGPQKSGKSTLAKLLALNVWITRMSIADPLREMLAVVAPGDHLLPEADKTLPVENLMGQSSRMALQTLGTEWGRRIIGEDIWINHALRRIDAITERMVVIDDVRFDNEYQVLKKRGAIMVRIERPGIESNDPHASEVDWIKWQPHFVLRNHRGVAQLQETGQLLLDHIDRRAVLT